jgi:uncharacterized Tic20 family protein
MSLDDAPERVTPREDQLEQVPSVPLKKADLDSDARQWAMFCHLSALLGLLAGSLTFLGPLICWLAKRESSSYVDYHGKEALNFHLNILIYNLVLVAISIATCGVGLIVTGPLLAALGIYAIVMSILAGLKANEGDYYRYPLTFRIIH